MRVGLIVSFAVTAILFSCSDVLKPGSTAPTAGLVAYYTFDSLALDCSGNGNNGALHGTTAVADRFGKMSARNFDGASYIDCGNDSSVQVTGRITLAAWINPASIANGEQKIIHKANSILSGYEIMIWNDTLAARVGGANVMIYASASSVIATGWQFVALTYDSSRVKLYKNGVVVRDTSCSYPLQNAAFNLTIGKRADRNDKYFIGAMDDIRIYNRALSDQEIETLYNEKH
jgi:hypothetical protein